MLLVAYGCATPDVEPASSLIGITKQDVEREWGKPSFAFRDSEMGQELIVYRFTEQYYRSTAVFILPIQKDTRVFCYLLKVDKTGVIEDYETPGFLSGVSRHGDCLVSFFGDDMDMSLHLARNYGMVAPLAARARKGDAEAAIVLAEEFGRTDELIALLASLCGSAQRGDGQAQYFVAGLMSEAHWRDLSNDRKAQLKAAGFFPNDVFAYYWYLQADGNDVVEAEARLTEIATDLSESDMSMARGWPFDPLTDFETTPGYRILVSRTPQVTGCPVPFTDHQDSEQMKVLRLEALASLGDVEAAHRIGDIETLKKNASIGNVAAAAILAAQYDDPRYALALVDQGDASVAYDVYLRLPKDERASPGAWKWLCHAANAGIAGARRAVGFWHRGDRQAGISTSTRLNLEKIGVRENDVVAYMWYTLAGPIDSKSASAKIPGHLRQSLSADDIARAEQMVREWKPGDCPSAEHRVPSPDGT